MAEQVFIDANTKIKITFQYAAAYPHKIRVSRKIGTATESIIDTEIASTLTYDYPAISIHSFYIFNITHYGQRQWRRSRLRARTDNPNQIVLDFLDTGANSGATFNLRVTIDKIV